MRGGAYLPGAAPHAATHGLDQTATDGGDQLDPREAARLLAQTEREARRQFDLSPQWINTVMGAVILVAYGSLWLSTRGQHPYKGPVAALPDGDSLSFTRLQDMLDLTPGNLITHLRKLEDAGYLTSETTGNGRASRTTITLTRQGRAALGTYTATLRDILAGL